MLTRRLGSCKFQKSSSILSSFVQPVPFVQYVSDLFSLAIGLPELWSVDGFQIPNYRCSTNSTLSFPKPTCIICQMHPHFWFNTLLQHKCACSSFYEGSVFWCQKKICKLLYSHILPYPEFKVPFGSFGFLNISHHLLNRLFGRPPTKPPTLSLPPRPPKALWAHKRRSWYLENGWTLWETVHLPQVNRESSQKN